MPPLFIVGTPLGNLDDISPRAIDTLARSDLILCESVNHTAILLNRFAIKGIKIVHFREENKKGITPHVIRLLKSGKNISLISDAGMPSISDPGSYLIDEAFKNSISLFCVPGPTAFASSLAICGFSADESVFLGFLPRRKSEIIKKFNFYRQRDIIIVFYESPNRIVSTIEIINEIDPTARILIAREMTKQYEEYIRGEPETIIKSLVLRKIKGEITVVYRPTILERNLEFDSRLLKILIEENIGTKSAAKIISRYYNTSSRRIYNEILPHKRP